MDKQSDFKMFNTHLLNRTNIHDFIFNYHYKDFHAGERMRDKHYHEAIEFECVLKGSILMCFDKDVVHLAKNDILIIAPNTPHAVIIGNTSHECKKVNIQLNPFIIDIDNFELIPDNLFNDSGYIKITSDVVVHSNMTRIVQELNESGWESDLLLKAEIMNFLITINRSLKSAIKINTDKNYISEAVDKINTNLSYPHTPSNIAETLHISPSYLMHLFKKEMGMPLMKYINNARLESSKELLIKSDKKISEIAQEIGIPVLQHFSMLFKSYTGMSPSFFRKINREVMLLDIEYINEG